MNKIEYLPEFIKTAEFAGMSPEAFYKNGLKQIEANSKYYEQNLETLLKINFDLAERRKRND